MSIPPDSRVVIRVKVLPEQSDPIEVNMNWFKRIKEAAFWKVVGWYLYARNSLNDFIAWLKER